ncbi:MAG: YggS family pyridoxal phosphate-dependent enzyme [Clostridia bacterium]|nr:YggS family pyridoxal phosphate-dependent enzyme [Clostridia bacterium]
MADEALLKRVSEVRRVLETASEGRYAPPRLIAVTKTHSAEEILPLLEAGITEIGENRVQEILAKQEALAGKFSIHLIGSLQTNKVKYIMKGVCLIQSVDRLKLAEEISRQAVRQETVMPVLVQVSPVGEQQKGGVLPEEVRPLLRAISGMEGLKVRGLMAVMPAWQDQEALEPLFAQMRTLYDHLRQEALPGIEMEELSMGMSGDYPLAARYGATMVRVGSAIMGARDYGRRMEDLK